MEIQGKTAVVTGGSTGIGRATALALAKAGADVVLAARSAERLEESCQQIRALGRKAIAVPTDVSKIDDVQRLFDAAIRELGQVDILFNNAGVHLSGPVENVSIEDWRWIVDINLWGVINGVNVFLPHMLERGSGHIVSTSSMAGLGGGLDMSIPYTTTKFAVVGLSEGLAVHLRSKGIGVSVLCPGFVLTDLAKGARLVPSGDPEIDRMRREFNERQQRGDWSALGDSVLPADVVGEKVVQAIRENRFLILTHENAREFMLERGQDLDQYVANRVEQLQQRQITRLVSRQ